MLKIGILPGDDIGPEVVPECVKAMKAAAARTGLEVEWSEHPIGRKGHELHGHTFPQVTIEALQRLDGWMLGPIGHTAYPRNDPKAAEAARRIDAAVDTVIAEAKHLTLDLGGEASTTEMGDAIAAGV